MAPNICRVEPSPIAFGIVPPAKPATASIVKGANRLEKRSETAAAAAAAPDLPQGSQPQTTDARGECAPTSKEHPAKRAVVAQQYLNSRFFGMSADQIKALFHFSVNNSPRLLLPLFAALAVQLTRHVKQEDLLNFWQQLLKLDPSYGIAAFSAVVFAVTVFVLKRPRRIFLVDFACYRPPEHLVITKDVALDRVTRLGYFDETSREFQTKVFERSGLGNRTYLPPSMHTWPPSPSISNARVEAEMVIFGALDELFAKTGVHPKDVSILVVNCTIFCPTPSLSAMVVNHYKMRQDIQSYNLGGMGCSASIAAVKLVGDLLQSQPNKYAVIVSTENITQNAYLGNRRSMQVTNVLFRMGGAAALISNKPRDAWRAKYELGPVVRTHMGADDKSYKCIYQEQDENKITGVMLSRELMATAAQALKANVTTLGPLVLPLSEKLLYAAAYIARRVFRMKIKEYVPDFKLAFAHFCIHPGGRALLDEVQKALNLSPYDMEPNRMTLYRWGNLSSASIWYELSYLEARDRVRHGDRVWQLAFGSGFKCQTATWRALRSIAGDKNGGPWAQNGEAPSTPSEAM
ncbi:hypothetical protein CLOM_g22784 [Closterium sp. NIES-68]|nr:hypothetical protein CLOM_g22784 [Closterium sp. NIES-68]GJP76519.1 hypothetical protein CLOP_g6951 [Closterium sp. NIES-67]